MLPEISWVGPFWVMPIIRPEGSGCTSALITPPFFPAARTWNGTPASDSPAVATPILISWRRFIAELSWGLGMGNWQNWQDGTNEASGASVAERRGSGRFQPLQQGAPFPRVGVGRARQAVGVATFVLARGFLADGRRHRIDQLAAGLDRHRHAAGALQVVHQDEGFGHAAAQRD